MSPTYAADTKVSVDRTRAEIERTLARYGASAFSYGYDPDRAVVMFAAHDRHVRFVLHHPPRSDYARTPTGLRRSEAAIDSEHAKAVRQRWRALALVVKAKLEAVEAGIVTFEEEFLAHVVLPDGRTVGEWAAPQLQETYATGEMPGVLPGASPRALTQGDFT